MKLVKKSANVLFAATLLVAGLGVGSVATGVAAPEAQAASCSGEARLSSGGYSKAITCSSSQYYEKVGTGFVYAPQKKKGIRSELTACYLNYKYSVAAFWL